MLKRKWRPAKLVKIRRRGKLRKERKDSRNMFAIECSNPAAENAAID
jgi:hypothetical protein